MAKDDRILSSFVLFAEEIPLLEKNILRRVRKVAEKIGKKVVFLRKNRRKIFLDTTRRCFLEQAGKIPPEKAGQGLLVRKKSMDFCWFTFLSDGAEIGAIQ